MRGPGGPAARDGQWHGPERGLELPASCLIDTGKERTDDRKEPSGAGGQRPLPGLCPRMGAGKGPQRMRNTSRPSRPALKIDCDNALTGPESGLYCAPLAATAAMRRAAGRALKRRPSRRLTDDGRPLYFRPLSEAARRRAAPKPKALSAAGCCLKIRQVICVGTRVNEPLGRKDRVTKMSSSSWSHFGSTHR